MSDESVLRNMIELHLFGTLSSCPTGNMNTNELFSGVYEPSAYVHWYSPIDVFYSFVLQCFLMEIVFEPDRGPLPRKGNGVYGIDCRHIERVPIFSAKRTVGRLIGDR